MAAKIDPTNQQRSRPRRKKGRHPSENVHELIDIIDQDIETIVAQRLRAETQTSQHQRIIEWITRSLGRPWFFYSVLCFVGGWILFNLIDPRLGLPAFDSPQFSLLQGIVGLSALLVAICVLITQNRQEHLLEQRRHLDLAVTLLVERKVSKMIALQEELRHDLPIVENRVDPQAQAMQETVNPDDVLATLHEHQQKQNLLDANQ